MLFLKGDTKVMIVLHQVLIMALLILTGVICFKTGIINKESTNSLSSLVLMVVNPIVIIVSYQAPFEKRLLKGLLWSLILSCISIAVAIIISKIFIHSKDEKASLERFASIYSNCGFMGIPLVNGLYGSEGVFYLTAFLTVFNIMVWTHGVYLMEEKFSKKMIIQALESPAIIATVLGFALFMLRIPLPGMLLKTLRYLEVMNTPLAMIAAGATIAQTNFFKALKNPRPYYICIIKLIIVPVTAGALFYFLPLDDVVIGTNILAAACPAAATGTLFAIRYKKDSFYASELFALTTVLSIITLPIIMMITGKII